VRDYALRQPIVNAGHGYDMRKSAVPFYPVPEYGTGRRARSFRRLLEKAVAMVKSGRIPSVAEVARAARVSRATAYRYFPSRSKLVSAMIAEALAPVRRAVPQHGDAHERLHELVDRTYSRFRAYEPHLRAGLQLALEHRALEAAGLLEEEPFRRGQRIEILKATLAPLRARLAPRAWTRLLRSLAVLYGIEPMVVLKDICRASDRETEAVVRWMMDAVLDAALRDRADRARRRRRRAR